MKPINPIKIIILLLLIQLSVLAQNNTINYGYDASGNRIQRRIIVVQPIAPPAINSTNDSILTIAISLSPLPPFQRKGGKRTS